jgi:hypothetical protein
MNSKVQKKAAKKTHSKHAGRQAPDILLFGKLDGTGKYPDNLR